jgi:hypothetical protein
MSFGGNGHVEVVFLIEPRHERLLLHYAVSDVVSRFSVKNCKIGTLMGSGWGPLANVVLSIVGCTFDQGNFTSKSYNFHPPRLNDKIIPSNYLYFRRFWHMSTLTSNLITR